MLSKNINITKRGKMKKAKKRVQKETIKIVSWKGNLHVACMILNSNQNSKSKEWAYKEIMKSADLLDKLNERGI
jgi:uroporphyrinogen-III decarboxylase|tara:strand:+ start:298 stop:519 length:222 start_codon:yes stop_codon:yes gene_type:complete